MTFQVQMEFMPGVSQIWVAQLTPEDPIYDYDNEAEAQAKADELQAADPTGRKYRVEQIAAEVEETPVVEEAPAIEETPVVEETPTEPTEE
jgi:hypothetical protein